MANKPNLADHLRTSEFAPDIYPGLSKVRLFEPPRGGRYFGFEVDGTNLIALYERDGTLMEVQDGTRGKTIFPVKEKDPVFAGRFDGGFTYFVQAENGPIKIGRANDVRDRMMSLQCGSPVTLTLLVTADGGRPVERAYHAQFAAHRIRGEWFHPHPDILAEIERLATLPRHQVAS